MSNPQNVPGIVKDDFISSICGEFLGRGTSREVYVYGPDPSLVIKLEVGLRFQNVMEHETYSTLVECDERKWFAPVVWISKSGNALLMKRTTPCPVKELPKRLPAFMTDLKPENFGLLDGQFVTHDYGTIGSMACANGVIMRKGFQRANWRLDE